MLVRWWRERNVRRVAGQLSKMQYGPTRDPGRQRGKSPSSTSDSSEAVDILKKTRFKYRGRGQPVGTVQAVCLSLPWYAFTRRNRNHSTGQRRADVPWLAEAIPAKWRSAASAVPQPTGEPTNEAVLIDTAGRYNAGEQRIRRQVRRMAGAFWACRRVLARHPLNGVPPTVSVADLQMTTQSGEVHAATLQARLNELREGLGDAIPWSTSW